MVDKKWEAGGSFTEPVNALEPIFKLAGGVNIIENLPSPIKRLAGIGVKEFFMQYNQDKNILQCILCTIETKDDWVILEEPLFKVNPKIIASVVTPTDISSRRVQFEFIGSFNIGEAVIDIIGYYPNFKVTGKLVKNKISVDEIMKLFKLNLELKADITVFSFEIFPSHNRYLLSGKIDSNWEITKQFVLKGISLDVSSINGSTNFKINGHLDLFQGTSLESIINLSANYKSQPSGWTFIGELETKNGLSIGQLIKYYLGWNITSIDLIIKYLKVLVDTGTKNWEITAGFSSRWNILFLDNLSVDAGLKIGNDKGSYYGKISADIKWHGVKLKIWFDYSINKNSQFGFSWEFLEGYVEKIKNNNKEEWIGHLKLNSSFTIGSLVEKMVSWVRGTPFGLDEPWNILNEISLNNISLEYNFTSEIIGFEINFSEISLGFASLKGVTISYDIKKKGVFVIIKGNFPWNIGDEKVGDTTTLGPFDTSKPQNAPTPSGSGNKFFEIRMLALGQHVALRDYKNITSVQKAIDAIYELPKTKPLELPDIGYSKDSGWIVGIDIGILKLSGKDEKGYMFNMQIVFNDPNLYALRIKMDGNSAKIFKGLDFQIMYKKVNETVGVYQAEITLPDKIRYLSIGAYSITLPVFAIEIYTNGDFFVDIGFPWNRDFRRSFSIEGIVAPGIPIMGSAGLYFGKLSSDTTDKVPKSKKGIFNPVIVFGFGIQAGVGKSIHYGVLEAGFSITIFAILEGVIAKWNPYIEDKSQKDLNQMQDSYYFMLKGAAGICGKLYGIIDFGIIKATIDITLSLSVEFIYESYKSIIFSVMAYVSVSASLIINLGLFKIRISFKFSLSIKETFEIKNSGIAPWNDGGQLEYKNGILRGINENRLTRYYECDKSNISLNFNNLLEPETKKELYGYISLSLTIAKNEWEDKAEMIPCYIAMLLLDTASNENAEDIIRDKAKGLKKDSSFELLCKMILKWVLASIEDKKITEDEINKKIVSKSLLMELKDQLKSSDFIISIEDVYRFLEEQFNIVIKVKNDKELIDAAYFPMIPHMKIETQYGNEYIGINYYFKDVNELSMSKITQLRDYFNQLAVKVEEEKEKDNKRFKTDNNKFSMSEMILTDYFILIASQMIEALIVQLRNYKYILKYFDTPRKILNWINEKRNDNNEFVLYDLFASNKTHKLNKDKKIYFNNNEYYITKDGDTIDLILSKLSITLESLTDNFKNSNPNEEIEDLFAIYEEKEYLNIPHLERFEVIELIKSAQYSNAIADISGMISRFYLHGLRITTEGITPKEMSMWVKNENDLMLPKIMGLYALTGQQFQVPSKIINDFKVTFSCYGISYLKFNNENKCEYEIIISQNSLDAIRINKIAEYAKGEICIETKDLNNMGMISLNEASYSFSSSYLINSEKRIDLAYGKPLESIQKLQIWKIPDDMQLSLRDKTKKNTLFSFMTGEYDEVKKELVSNEIPCYSFATKIEFTVKAFNLDTDNFNVYELHTASEQSTYMLEKLLREGGTLINQILMSFKSSDKNMFIDNPEFVDFFAMKANLSTITYPRRYYKNHNKSSKKDYSKLIKLFWEAFITNNGGFYLYYNFNDKSNKVQRGLPKEIFNDKGEASICLIILYEKPEDKTEHNKIYDYMNSLVTCDNLKNLVYARSAKENIVVSESGNSINELLHIYNGKLVEFAEYNKNLILKNNQEIIVKNGVYQYTPQKEQIGGDFGLIAKYFKVNVNELKKINNKFVKDKLDYYDAIYLPDILLKVNNKLNTFEKISKFYNCGLNSLIRDNCNSKNIYSEDQKIKLTSYKSNNKSNDLGRVISVSTRRESAEPVPDDPKDSEFCNKFILNNFSMFGYKIMENQYFYESNIGLPIGATDGANGVQMYNLSIPYTKFIKEENIKNYLPHEEDSPYLGIGNLLQIDYWWNDHYGNTININNVNNKTPIIIGYTDELISFSAWPSISADYQVLLINNVPVIRINMTFDKSSYDKEINTSWKENIERDAKVYEGLFYQLTDLLGVEYEINTSLFTKSVILNESNQKALINWLFHSQDSIYKYLYNSFNFEDKFEVREKFNIDVELTEGTRNNNEIFELTVDLTIKRKKNIVMAGFEDLIQILETTTNILAKTSLDENRTLSLKNFSINFENALMELNKNIRVGTGINRYMNFKNESSNIWAISQSNREEEGIYFDFKNEEPVIYIPRPISNKLIGKNEPIEIYDYVTGIGLSKESRKLMFQNIDMDNWIRQLFDSLEYVLTPKILSKIALIDNIKNTEIMEQIINQKKELAGIMSSLLTTVFEEDREDNKEFAVEYFYEHLLNNLSNLYTTKGLIIYKAKVKADIKDERAKKKPNLYGIIEGSNKENAKVLINSSKIKLDTCNNGELAVIVTGDQIIKDDNLSVLSKLSLDLTYKGSNIEHQIDEIPSINGYNASSWISVINSDNKNNYFIRKLKNVELPLILRSYPDNPSLIWQKDTDEDIKCGYNDWLKELFSWNYTFAYTIPFHFPQDHVEGSVKFDSMEKLKCNNIIKAFDKIAQFITNNKAIRKDMEEIVELVEIDSEQSKLNHAIITINTFTLLVQNIIDSLKNNELILNKAAEGPEPLFEFNFTIQESIEKINNVDGLVITIWGEPPKETSAVVLIEPDKYKSILYQKSQNKYSYWFKDKETNLPLEASKGQTIAERQISITGLSILKVQKAITSMYIFRNKNLVSNKTIKESFIYSTGETSFENPIYVSKDTDAIIDTNMLYENAVELSLEEHFNNILDKLFSSVLGKGMLLQLELKHGFLLDNEIETIYNHIFLQLPIPLEDCYKKIKNWSYLTNNWLRTYIFKDNKKSNWAENAHLNMDLILLNQIDGQNKPFLRLRNIKILGEHISSIYYN